VKEAEILVTSHVNPKFDNFENILENLDFLKQIDIFQKIEN
jgi:hypothetical protein